VRSGSGRGRGATRLARAAAGAAAAGAAAAAPLASPWPALLRPAPELRPRGPARRPTPRQTAQPPAWRPGSVTQVGTSVPPGVVFSRDASGFSPPAPGGGAADAARLRDVYSGTRGLMEGVARRLLARNPRVSVRYGAQVSGLELGGGGGKPAVAGVRLAGGGAVACDLVVDASGRGSRAPEWLAAAGLEAPGESVVDSNVGYVSA
jgi:hypothetical protein